ncbi:ATP-binding protein [Chloroflexota bacterium]
MPVIDPSKCNGCGLCIEVCQCGALVKFQEIVTVVETEDCGWCLQCEIVCPTGAIVCPFEIVIEES